jgi:hypothetical protein
VLLQAAWDREWHQAFQDFRYRLVSARSGDRGWEQASEGPSDRRAVVVLEDYLEIAPRAP